MSTIKIKLFQTILLLLIAICIIPGCSSSSDDDTVTQAEKDRVLRALATAFNDSARKETNFVDGNNTSSLQSQSSSPNANTWIIDQTINLGTETKNTYDLGPKSFTKTRELARNELHNTPATFNNWVFEITSNNQDTYTEDEFPSYNTSFHNLSITTTHNVVEGNSTTIYHLNSSSKINGTITYPNGTLLEIKDGFDSFTIASPNILYSATIPLVFHIDTDGNSVKEQYQGTLSMTNVNIFDDTVDFYLINVTDSSGTNYGTLKIYRNGNVELNPN